MLPEQSILLMNDTTLITTNTTTSSFYEICRFTSLNAFDIIFVFCCCLLLIWPRQFASMVAKTEPRVDALEELLNLESRSEKVLVLCAHYFVRRGEFVVDDRLATKEVRRFWERMEKMEEGGNADEDYEMEKLMNAVKVLEETTWNSVWEVFI